MKAPPRSRQGFSLIEITLCIGILAFTIIPLVTLLGVGLQAEREAREQGTAGRIATLAAASLLAFSPNGAETFSAGAPLDAISWQPGPAVIAGPVYFDQDANVLPGVEGAHYALRMRLEGARDTLQQAVLVVVWPPTATVEWTGGRAKIQGAFGQRQDVIHLPRR